eukprot:2854919-Amphidinium_carterae.3
MGEDRARGPRVKQVPVVPIEAFLVLMLDVTDVQSGYQAPSGMRQMPERVSGRKASIPMEVGEAVVGGRMDSREYKRAPFPTEKLCI